jgi:hypothetical protein
VENLVLETKKEAASEEIVKEKVKKISPIENQTEFKSERKESFRSKPKNEGYARKSSSSFLTDPKEMMDLNLNVKKV